jgi:hypothetical protein
MKENIETCRFNKPKLEMVSPNVSATVDYCKFWKRETAPTICKFCEWYEPTLVNRIKSLFKHERTERQ